MRKFLFILRNRFSVYFRHITQKTKMKKITSLLDGSEQSMIPIIKNNAKTLNNINNGQQIISLEEFSVGTGISDLTIFTIDDKLLSRRQKSTKKPVTSKSQIQVLLAVLDSESITLSEIANKVLLSKQTVSRIIKRLIDFDLVVQVSYQEYRASYDLKDSASDNIIAIEAKVKNWKSGVRQALRYKEYADYSYLAIYENNIKSCIENIEIFKRFGIGLIGVNDTGIKVYLKASLSDMATTENKVLAFERFLSAIDDRYETFKARNGFATKNT